MEYIIGVDAGGTKTVATLYNADGDPLASAQTGFGNMTGDSPKALENIGDALARCLAEIPESSGVRAIIGAAGIHAGDNQQRLAAYISQRFPALSTRLTDDALLALYALHRGGDGILAIAGTGSISYGKRDRAIHRIGGWGNILGDEGSGYDIARKALARITAEYDAGNGYGALSGALLNELGTDVFGVVHFVHTQPKGRVAALLPIIARAAESGDDFARELLTRAGEDLAGMVKKLQGRMGGNTPCPVAVKGGVLEKAPMVFQAFSACLNPERLPILSSRAPSELGAYYMYMEERA